MNVAVVQMEPEVGDFTRNYQKIVEFTKSAKQKGAQIVLFPELSISGYTLDERTLLEGSEFFNKVSADLVKLSRKLDVAIVLGTPRIVNGKIRNSTAVIRKKNEIIFYDKTHLFRNEKKIFEAGEGFLVFKHKEVNFGILTCYEIGFPEISRILALKGAQVILASFAFGKERWRIYDTATKARAIENGCFLLASSTIGKGLMDFIGHSRIVHPSGKILSEIEEEEGIIVQNVDLSVIHHYRFEEKEDSHAYFLGRRGELYREICRSYEGKQ